jgi:hypothetical protein
MLFEMLLRDVAGREYFVQLSARAVLQVILLTRG